MDQCWLFIQRQVACCTITAECSDFISLHSQFLLIACFPPDNQWQTCQFPLKGHISQTTSKSSTGMLASTQEDQKQGKTHKHFLISQTAHSQFLILHLDLQTHFKVVPVKYVCYGIMFFIITVFQDLRWDCCYLSTEAPVYIKAVSLAFLSNQG